MDNFFDKIQTPSLDNNYARNLDAVITAINNNFAKISSLPFLKGDKGTSIEIHDEEFLVFNQDSSSYVMTDFAKALIRTIYNIPDDIDFNSFDDINNITHEQPINNIYSHDSLHDLKFINVFFDKMNGKKHLSVPFMFHDSRKNYLHTANNYIDGFIDFSTYVTGYFADSDWTFVKGDFIPKLYFDDSIQKFCWTIGSQKTNVIAQGVEGKEGNGLRTYTCEGILNTDRTYITITKVLAGIDNAEDNYYDYENNNIQGPLNQGDFVVVVFENNSETNTYRDLAFGGVIMINGRPNIKYIEGTTIFTSTKNISLQALLDGIGEPPSSQSNVRGLYVFSDNEQQAAMNQTQRTPHMFWADSNSDAHLGIVAFEDRTKPSGAINPDMALDSTLNIDYKYIKSNILDSTLYTHKNSGKIFSYGEDNTDKLELNSTTPYVFDGNGDLVFFPNPNIEYLEPKHNKSKTIFNLKLNNSLSANNTTSGFSKNTVTLGGEFNIKLPYFGLNIQNSNQILETVQFKNNNTYNDLTLKLSPIEINNNEYTIFDASNSSSNGNSDELNILNNNSSIGFRYFYDMPLMASPINKDSNGDICVYAGTNEWDLSADFRGKTIKTRMKMTILQYQIGYDSNGNLSFKNGSPYADMTISGINNTSTTIPTRVIEYNTQDWFKNDTTGDYFKFTHVTDTYPNTNTKVTMFAKLDTNQMQYVIFDINTGLSNTPTTYYIMQNDSNWNMSIEKYSFVGSWENKSFKNITTVNEVVYYILPIGSTSNGDYVDLFSLLNMNNYYNQDFACMRYRMFFKDNITSNENAHTIHINDIDEPNTNTATLTVANNDYMNIFLNNENTIINRENSFIVSQGSRAQTSVEINGKYYIYNLTNTNGLLGKYNDFIWNSGSAAAFEGTSINPIPIVGLGSGSLLPTSPLQINSKWLLNLNNINNAFDTTIKSPKAYNIYTALVSNPNHMTNRLSDNTHACSRYTISNESFVLRPKTNSGWYIDDNVIDITPANNVFIYDSASFIQNSGTNNDSGNSDIVFDPDLLNNLLYN